MASILVTGANGFIGRALVNALSESGHKVYPAGRSVPEDIGRLPQWRNYDLGTADPDFTALLDRIDTVIHLAAHVHVRAGTEADPAMFRHYNSDATAKLVVAAVAAGVKQFVYLSSIGVNGNGVARLADALAIPYTETSPPQPHNAYSISKYEAEQAVIKACATSGTSWIILRCPLVYGPGVKSSFLQLMEALNRGWPLPFKSINNLRSMIYLENLLEVITRCVDEDTVGDRLFLVSDYDLSLVELCEQLASSLGTRARLFPCPRGLLGLAGVISGRSAAVNSLVNSLLIDNSEVRKGLDWSPSVPLEQGLERTAQWYMGRR